MQNEPVRKWNSTFAGAFVDRRKWAAHYKTNRRENHFFYYKEKVNIILKYRREKK